MQKVKVKLKQSHYRPGGFQEAETPRLEDNRHMKAVRLSALGIGRLYLQDIFLVLISVRGWVNPRAIVRPQGLCQSKIPMTPTTDSRNTPSTKTPRTKRSWTPQKKYGNASMPQQVKRPNPWRKMMMMMMMMTTTMGNRTREIRDCSAVRQTTSPPRAPAESRNTLKNELLFSNKLQLCLAVFFLNIFTYFQQIRVEINLYLI